MNSSEVSKLLGVSMSTIQRWVKQLNLPMERNERGHYLFTQEDIIYLEKIKHQIQNGALLQDIAPIQIKQPRKGTKKSVEFSPDNERILIRVSALERLVEEKADKVTSYQLLHHRREIEELQCQVAELSAKLAHMEAAASIEIGEPPVGAVQQLVLDRGIPGKRKKKRNIIGMLFGF